MHLQKSVQLLGCISTVRPFLCKKAAVKPQPNDYLFSRKSMILQCRIPLREKSGRSPEMTIFG